MTNDILLFIAIGFAAQMVDGAIGMAYGITATTVLMGFGVPPATASASVHAAEVFTTAASGTAHPHIVGMPPAAQSIDRPSVSHAVGLDRWETDGGAIGAPANERGGSQALLSEEEAHILQCLGAAVLLQWNGLPTRIQRELFEHSFDAVAPRGVARLKRRIARFLHEHKDDAGGAK